MKFWNDSTYRQNIRYLVELSFSVKISISGNCSEHYDLAGNQLMFEFTPSLSEANIICNFKISTPDDRSVLLKFDSFNVPATTDCMEASLQIYDGVNTNSPKIGDRLCGNTLKPDVESSGNNLLILFQSSANETAAKFDLRYETNGTL